MHVLLLQRALLIVPVHLRCGTLRVRIPRLPHGFTRNRRRGKVFRINAFFFFLISSISSLIADDHYPPTLQFDPLRALLAAVTNTNRNPFWYKSRNFSLCLLYCNNNNSIIRGYDLNVYFTTIN